LKKYKFPGSDQILAELIQAGGEILLCSTTNKQTNCSNCSGISLLSTSYKILLNILQSRLSPYIDEIIGDHQCGFQHNRSTTDQIFCICQILEKKWEYNETVHQLFIHRLEESLIQQGGKYCTIFSDFVVPMELVTLIKMCLNKTHNEVRIGKHLSDSFPIQKDLKQGDDALSPLLFNFALEYAIRSRKTKWN
jgi:hypothetical protein